MFPEVGDVPIHNVAIGRGEGTIDIVFEGKRESSVQMNEELEKLQGKWKVVTLEVEGQRVPGGFFSGAKIVVNGDNFSTASMGARYADTLTLDMPATPRGLTYCSTRGRIRGKRRWASTS